MQDYFYKYNYCLDRDNRLINLQAKIEQAADLIANSTAIVIAAGAGMGVDSGLPDFRGKQGFWNTYPSFQESNLGFTDVAQPSWFEKNPHLAWGFYGHRLNMYRSYDPHEGYQILRKWTQEKSHFVMTSNVDGFFKKSKFQDSSIWEIHGSIHHLQNLTDLKSNKIISADPYVVNVDEKTFYATGDLPSNEHGILRPNILMFMDYGWISDRETQQREKFEKWEEQADLSRLVVIECGAGSALPSIRCMGGELIDKYGGVRIRINPEEYHSLDGVGIPLGAKDALNRIDSFMNHTD